MKKKVQKNTLGVMIILLVMSLAANLLYMDETRFLRGQASSVKDEITTVQSAKMKMEKELLLVKAELSYYKQK